MTRETGPVFVQRRTYRRRRMQDAARLLPILGAVLILLPLLWSGEEARTARVMLYLFVIWILLVGLAAFLSAYLATPEEDEEPEREQ